ncbi:hypothetical protein CEXT_711341 [Caerostris extrusa]|uniref:Uncharacterized protein n=1 Tax=Caerostris extrusa TaxID=172846 RepID=A0AAV4Y480_CAEEX|nr:hypothetical protein CEXT_711341 [Caerostris extrusa]
MYQRIANGSSKNLVPEPACQMEEGESRTGIRPGRFQQRRQRAQNSCSYSGAREPNGYQEPAPADRKDPGKVKRRFCLR